MDYVARSGGSRSTALWRVSFLGGTPKKLLENVNTPIGWSPDGRHMAFVRNDLSRGVFRVGARRRGRGESSVCSRRGSFPLRSPRSTSLSRPSVRPAWSLDGRVIAGPGCASVPGRSRSKSCSWTAPAVRSRPCRFKARCLGLGLARRQFPGYQIKSREVSGLSQLWRLAYPERRRHPSDQ